MWLQSLYSMCVDSSVKTSCATDINANNVHNDSIDFDPKVISFKNSITQVDEPCQAPGLNFIVEEHQQVSSKNCEVPLAGAEMIAVDAFMKIINFDIPKENFIISCQFNPLKLPLKDAKVVKHQNQ
uniref:Uncharacterized protein n=1 Tax=Tanacetum cinerariifolium TaxID=118510 RepID=A0A6L2MCL0_TANCI|nr:hypothetical protein [Tanacetum cinerariifolium]